MSERLDRLERRLGYRFEDRAILETALSHRSHAHERSGEPGPESNYERLEFLGDAMLGMIVSEWLYRDDPSAAEGLLSRRRQAVVRSATLAAVAHGLDLGAAILLGKGEESTGGRAKPSLLADVFEALLGAVYLDGGIRAARAFVRRHLGDVLRSTHGAAWKSDDFKTRLQETTQSKLQQVPRYRIVSSAGPDHALEFVVEVRVADEVLGRGTGSNRKQAEQEAARCALGQLGERGG